MLRVHALLRAARSAPASPAEAPYDHHALVAATKPPRERQQHGDIRGKDTEGIRGQEPWPHEAAREYHQPC